MNGSKIQSDLEGLTKISSLKKKVRPKKDIRTIDRVSQSYTKNSGNSFSRNHDNP